MSDVTDVGELTISESTVPAFDYDLIPDTLRDDLISDRDQIRAYQATEIAIAARVGVIFNKWKELLPHGQFMEWIAAEFPRYSHSTVNNYMNLAVAFGDVPEHLLLHMDMGASYRLASGKVPEERRAVARQLLESGQHISSAVAYVIAESPTWVLRMYLDGEISARDAQTMSEELSRYPTTVESYAQKWGVRSAAAVRFIGQAILQHQERPDESLLSELQHTNGWLQSGEFSVHIRDATSSVLEAYLAERERRRVQEVIARKYRTYRAPCRFHRVSGGRLLLTVPADLDLSELRRGEKVEVEIRVLRRDE